MNEDWKQDPKLKNMDVNKLNFLTSFAKKVETAPKDQIISSLLTMNMEAQKKGIRFSDQETDILVSILSSNMTPEDRKKLDTLKMLSKKLSSKR